MPITIALAGNPNCGKTTLFNALTGSNQFVGNWPGVTVEKKEGKMKKHSDVIITDLPGIYSLSPYTLEEVVARNYLINERPDAILDVIDGTNLERNLYLTTQLAELGIPVVLAVNMIDVVRKNGDIIRIEELSKAMGCPVVEISALRGTGIEEAAEAAIEAAKGGKTVPMHMFSGAVEHALAHIEEAVVHDLPEEQQRWYSIKIFERDQMALQSLNIPPEVREHIEKDIRRAEEELDDDAESIITNERYIYIGTIVRRCYKRKNEGSLSTSDKIDRIVTNRFLALPIFALIMVIVYYVSITTVGTAFGDWVNGGLFGEGWHFFGYGDEEYTAAAEIYGAEHLFNQPDIGRMLEQAKEREFQETNGNTVAAQKLYEEFTAAEPSFASFSADYEQYAPELEMLGFDIRGRVDPILENAPKPEQFGAWIPGIPTVIGNLLDSINCADWLKSLVLDGIVAGVGAVLGFLPQMLMLFFFLALLESCGYMSRIAFVMDKIFRKFGLSGKSFIPMLVGTGCGVPGVMASRTIENERDRRMTIMTTTFIPCGAKLPVISLISTALFGGAWWVAPSAYFIGMAAIVMSGIMLKKTRLFSGDPAPFVMELPPYHLPLPGNVFRTVWDRGWSFVKKAGTVILISSIVIWAGSRFGWINGVFCFNIDMELQNSILGIIGSGIKWIFIPLGFGDATAAVATVMGLIAKEEIVGVFGVLELVGMTRIAAYSFLVFNLLCAPCIAAVTAISREMGSAKWTAFAISYQCVFAYAVSLCIFQIGTAIAGSPNIAGLIAAAAVIALIGFLLFRPGREQARIKAR